jgi:hypothetical protein
MRFRLIWTLLLVAVFTSVSVADAATVPGLTPPGTQELAVASSAYTSMDVGFNGGLADLDGMAAYVPGRSPLIRAYLNWWYVEGCRGCPPRWDRIDPVVDGAVARGMRVMLLLAYAPPWANGNHLDDRATTWFPTDDADWTSIVDRTVRHFGGRVEAYEVWNEPNLPFFGKYDGDTRTRYWQLVRLAHQAIHAACTGCTVVAGPSAGVWDGGDPANEPAVWLDWAYQNGFRDDFDALALHPYPEWNPAQAECDQPWKNMFGPPGESPPCGELASVHSIMVRNGDTAKKIWATEWGYPMTAAGAPPLATVRDRFVKSVAMWRQLTYTGPLFLYQFRDGCADATSQCNFGVMRMDGTPKEPVFTDLSAALTYLRPECIGNPDPPPTTVSATMPAGGCWYSSWPVRSLRSTDGRFRLTLQTDGNLVLYMNDSTPLWASGTTTGTRLNNQLDGNLVLHRADGTVVWSTGTWGKGPSTLRMQNDGNLVLYRNSDQVALWSTRTWGH